MADHEVLSEESGSTMQHGYALVVQDLLFVLGQRHEERVATIHVSLRETWNNLHSSVECTGACEDLNWNHDTVMSYRSETNGLAARAVRRLAKGDRISFGAIWSITRMVERRSEMLLLLA